MTKKLDYDGKTVNSEYLKTGMTDAIRELVSLTKDAIEAEEALVDYGMELYNLHEVNGGRESDDYSDCSHATIFYVADGDFRQISNGKTKVWCFCAECGEQVGTEHVSCYWTWLVYQRADKRKTWDDTERDFIQKIPAEYDVPSGILRPEQARPKIIAAVNRRKRQLAGW